MSAVLARVAVVCLLLAVLSPLVMLAGCARTERAMVDPKAFSFWVVP